MSPADHALRDALSLAQFIYYRAGLHNRLPLIRIRDVQRGRWYEQTDSITLPLWLWTDFPRRLEAYRIWYIAHELAHHLMRRPGHDLHFQTMLAMLAPNEWHWESTYKPREYDRAVRALGQNGMSSSSCGLITASSIDQTSRASHPSHR